MDGSQLWLSQCVIEEVGRCRNVDQQLWSGRSLTDESTISVKSVTLAAKYSNLILFAEDQRLAVQRRLEMFINVGLIGG